MVGAVLAINIVCGFVYSKADDDVLTNFKLMAEKRPKLCLVPQSSSTFTFTQLEDGHIKTSIDLKLEEDNSLVRLTPQNSY